MAATVPPVNALNATAVTAKEFLTFPAGAPNIPGVRPAANALFLTNLEEMPMLSTTTLMVLTMLDSGKLTL